MKLSGCVLQKFWIFKELEQAGMFSAIGYSGGSSQRVPKTTEQIARSFKVVQCLDEQRDPVP
jgi:hypothetical protein